MIGDAPAVLFAPAVALHTDSRRAFLVAHRELLGYCGSYPEQRQRMQQRESTAISHGGLGPSAAMGSARLAAELP